VHHRTSERPGDAIHGLDPRDHQLAKLIDIARLGADDHVVGLMTSSASWTPSIPTISSATRAALLTSVWTRMYAVTTINDPLASSRPGRTRVRLRRMRWLLVLSLTGLAACSSGDGQPRAERALPEPITLSSPAFTEGAAIPQRFTCDGDNLSPPLRWSELPTGTVEVALVVDDPDAPRGTYVHWVVVGLDPASTKLAEGMVPPGARQLRNSAGKAAYTGPCPPGGPPHHYRFTIYALQRPPEVGDDARPEAAIQAIGAAATARGRLVGTYGR
jgi:Raf kinase inhibitor-like YbhB/YbcL family protein